MLKARFDVRQDPMTLIAMQAIASLSQDQIKIVSDYVTGLKIGECHVSKKQTKKVQLFGKAFFTGGCKQSSIKISYPHYNTLYASATLA
jgi:hypothetical protein